VRPLTLFVMGSLLCSPVVLADTPAAAGASHQIAPASLPETPETALLNRLIGTWDVAYEIYDKDGKLRTSRGQVIYRWILDGAALQEVWTSDAHDTVARPYGTSIGFHDGKRQRWTQVWIYPAQGMTTIVTGGAADGALVLTGRDEDGALQRWAINDIQADSFAGRYEITQDDGKTWRLLGVNHMRRHPE
jgi:hypothetical protein